MDLVQQYQQHLKFRGIPYKITAHCRKPFVQILAITSKVYLIHTPARSYSH